MATAKEARKGMVDERVEVFFFFERGGGVWGCVDGGGGGGGGEGETFFPLFFVLTNESHLSF